MSFIPSNLYFTLHPQSTIVSPIHVTQAGTFSSISTFRTVISCRCMLEEEIECRLVIAQNEKRYLQKVFLNKESRNPKICLLQQSDFHKHVCWSWFQSFECYCGAQYFLAFCLHFSGSVWFYFVCSERRNFCLLFVRIFCLRCARTFSFVVCEDFFFFFFWVCAMTFCLQCADLFCLQCAGFILFLE